LQKNPTKNSYSRCNISFTTGQGSMKSTYKLLSWLLVLLTVAATAQTNPVTNSGKREVVLWGLSLGPETKGQDAVIREFERRNPDVKVKLLSMGAGRMDPQKLMTSIVGNVAPDVINQDRFTISDWASRGAFQALDGRITRDSLSDPLCPSEKQYYPATWKEASYGGKVYAIPTSSDNRILYWNKKIFHDEAANLRAAGLDPERAPRTWSELLAYSKVLTKFDDKGNLVRAGFMPNFGNSWLYMYAFQNNASFLSADGRTCTMNTPESREALDYIVKGYDIVGGYEKAKSFESGFQGKENDCFIVGQVVMKIDGDWILNALSRYAPDFELQGDPPPVPDDRYNHRGRFASEKDTFVTWMGGFSLAIPKGAKNPEDGWRLIKFMTSTEGRLIENKAQAAWERMRGRIFIPRQIANIEANETSAKIFKPASPFYAEAIDMHTKMARYGRIRPATFAGQVLWSEHVKAMEAACYKKATSEQALQDAQVNVQRELNAFYDKEKYPVLNLKLPAYFGILALFGFLAYFVRQFTKARIGTLEKHEAKWAYVFVSPWVLGFLILTIGPMIASLFFSFTQWDVLNEARFVGLKNYQDMFGADWKAVSKSLSNVAYLTGVGVPLGVSTGLAIALLLNTASRGIRFYRTFFYMPSIVPVIASAVLWTWVLTADPGKGLINSYWVETITKWLGVPPPGWLNSAEWSKPALLLQGVWGAGGGMVLWLAGLKGVPTSLYEAASIDGANGNKQFFSITFPMLSPIIFFNLVTGFIGAMQEFDRVYVMRPSLDGPIGPDDSMLTPTFHLFNNGFAFFKMGYASSLAWLIFVLVMLVTYIQWKLKDRWVHTEVS
jgi:ABC-type sugar transport system permease subunit/ABC-type glycerol-3-phosphate transport system substrate-binding protein